MYPIPKLVAHTETVEHPCHPNIPFVLQTNPGKNRIIHEISTNPESTPLRTCFSWLHLFLGSLRYKRWELHFRGSAWPPRPCNCYRWISHVNKGCQRSTETKHKLIHHTCSNTDVLCYFLLLSSLSLDNVLRLSLVLKHLDVIGKIHKNTLEYFTHLLLKISNYSEDLPGKNNDVSRRSCTGGSNSAKKPFRMSLFLENLSLIPQIT